MKKVILKIMKILLFLMMKKLLNNLHPNLINYELNLVILLPYMISSKKENFIMKKNMYLDITIEIIINTKIILIEIDIDKTNSMNLPTMMIAINNLWMHSYRSCRLKMSWKCGITIKIICYVQKTNTKKTKNKKYYIFFIINFFL